MVVSLKCIDAKSVMTSDWSTMPLRGISYRSLEEQREEEGSPKLIQHHKIVAVGPSNLES